jgi:hypothetical protein
MEKESILLLVLYAVALGMGVVSIVLSILGEPVDVILLGIGVAALGLAGLTKLDNKK